MEVDDLLRHIRSHTDAEAIRAYNKDRRGRVKVPKSKTVDTSVGSVVVKKKPEEYVQLDENNESVVISSNGETESM